MKQQINLYHEPKKQELTFVNSELILYAAVAMLAVVFGYYSFISWRHDIDVHRLEGLKSKLIVLNKDLTTALNQRSKMPAKDELDLQLVDALKEYDAINKVVAAIESPRFGSYQGFSIYIEAAVNKSMTGLQLQKINLKEGANNIELIGVASSPKLLPQFLQNLSDGRPYNFKSFSSLDIKERNANDEEVSFAIKTKEDS